MTNSTKVLIYLTLRYFIFYCSSLKIQHRLSATHFLAYFLVYFFVRVRQFATHRIFSLAYQVSISVPLSTALNAYLYRFDQFLNSVPLSKAFHDYLSRFSVLTPTGKRFVLWFAIFDFENYWYALASVFSCYRFRITLVIFFLIFFGFVRLCSNICYT